MRLVISTVGEISLYYLGIYLRLDISFVDMTFVVTTSTKAN